MTGVTLPASMRVRVGTFAVQIAKSFGAEVDFEGLDELEEQILAFDRHYNYNATARPSDCRWRLAASYAEPEPQSPNGYFTTLMYSDCPAPGYTFVRPGGGAVIGRTLPSK